MQKRFQGPFMHRDQLAKLEDKAIIFLQRRQDNGNNSTLRYQTADESHINKLQMKYLIILSLAITLAICDLAPCEPFGLRIYYGDVLLDHLSAEKGVIYFNTKEPCKASFLNVISEEGFKKVACTHTTINTSAFVNFYTPNVHVCTLTNIPFEESFKYAAYGLDDNSAVPTPHKLSWVETSLVDPRPKNRDVRVVALADWGTIKKNIDIMTPITNDLNRVLHEQKIDALLIDGDVAYDLDSNNGSNYEDFLFLLEQVSYKTPIIHVPGNHERRSPDAALLFNSSFKIYGLDKKLATGLSLGSLFILPFDPYNIIYGYTETLSSLDALKAELKRGVESGRFIMPCSHYPLICSGQYSECFNEFIVMHSYFDSMLESGVSLYVGAHTHSYERNYPYFKDHSFLTLEGPYDADSGYLISVVEGVAGNDKDILTVMEEQKDYTAKYTVNETGFAVIESNEHHVTYSHFSTKQGFMDEFEIRKRPMASKPKRVKLNLAHEQQ